MLNRRGFIAAGLGSVFAARALPTDKMRYAMSGHEFVTTLPHPEAGIKMAARYGYHGLEPFQEDVAKYLSKPPEQLKEVLDASGLALCTIGSGGQYLDPEKLPATIENSGARARYIAHFGCKHLKVNLSRRVGDGVANLSVENAKILAKNLNEVGKHTAAAGIKFSFHPHCWTLQRSGVAGGHLHRPTTTGRMPDGFMHGHLLGLGRSREFESDSWCQIG